MRKWAAIIAVLLALFSSQASIAVSSEFEYQRLLKIQVAYLLNFAKFIDWPALEEGKGNSSFVIGVYGTNPFNGLLHDLNSKTVHGKRVETRILTSISQVEACQILFVSGDTNQTELFAVLDSLQAKPVLTVSNSPGFVSNGGIIELQQQGDYVLFSINLESAGKSGLVIPAQVLALAVEVALGSR